jgi:hypothetical protein
MNAIEIDDMEVWKSTKLTVIVNYRESGMRKLLKGLGLWIARIGFIIAGVGKVEIKDA